MSQFSQDLVKHGSYSKLESINYVPESSNETVMVEPECERVRHKSNSKLSHGLSHKPVLHKSELSRKLVKLESGWSQEPVKSKGNHGSVKNLVSF